MGSLKTSYFLSLIIEAEEEPYWSFVSDDMDVETIEIFQNNHLGGTEQKSCSVWPAEALAKN